ncbi:MAG: hypothetical protein K8R16_13140, partial [Anaerolineales bacterium]|nr:hypothetical protein [Anaerolineales bacterium]
HAPVAQWIGPSSPTSLSLSVRSGQTLDFELDGRTENPFHGGEPALIPAGEVEGSVLSTELITICPLSP